MFPWVCHYSPSFIYYFCCIFVVQLPLMPSTALHISLQTLCAVIAFGIGYYMHQQLTDKAPPLNESFEQRTRRFIRLLCNGDSTDQLRVLIDSLDANELSTLLRTECVPDVDFTQTDDAHLNANDRLNPLATAVYYGHADTVALLLKKGADVHQKSAVTIEHNTTANCTPLLLAAALGRLEVCRVLIENGAVVDLGTDNGHTPLMIACSNGWINIVRFLLSKGSRTELMDNTGTHFALLDAARRGHFRVCRALVKAGADVNQAAVEGKTALMKAARRDRLRIVTFLVEHGANIDHTDNDGQTPLMGAARRGRKRTVTFLVEHGANIDHTDNDGHTPLMGAARRGHRRTVTFLVEHGANIDHTDNDGHTPLMHALDNNRTGMVQHLLTAGASTEPLNIRGDRFALLVAAGRGYLDLCRALMDARADVNQATVDGNTALMEAAGRGFLGIVVLLVEHGANIDLADNDGHTPLMYALDNDRTDVVQNLMTAGASTDPGKSAMDLATEREDEEMMNLLAES